MLPNTISLTRQRQAIFLCELPLHIVGEQYLLIGLRQWSNMKIDLGRVTVKTLKDDLTQRELYEIETHPKPPITRFQCVVQPDAGYVIRKLMTFNRNGGRIDTYQCDDYETVNGFSFPKSGLHEHYLISNQLAFSVKYRLKSFTLNSSEVSDRLFERDIPEGTLVWDEDNHVHVPYTGRVQTHVDEAIQNAGTKTGLWRSWYLWTGVLLATLGVGSYLIRRRWREKRQLSSAHS